MSEIDGRLVDLFCRLFGEKHRPNISMDTTMADIPEWDSLSFLNVILEIEKTFGIAIRPNDAVKMTSIRSITEVIRNKQGAA